jgi:hypothetical protein
MKKEFIIILILGLLFIVVMILGSKFLIQPNKPGSIAVTPTIDPNVSSIPPSSTALIPLSVVSAEPADKKEQVPPNTNLILTFNRNVSADEVELSINPETTIGVAISGNRISFTFSDALKEGTQYIYLVRYPKENRSDLVRSFTTSGQSSTSGTVSAPLGIKEIRENFQRTNHPDVLVANYTPHQENTFSAVNIFKKTPIDHYSFIVTLIPPGNQQGKADFATWLSSSLKLTPQQIANLDVSYQ